VAGLHPQTPSPAGWNVDGDWVENASFTSVPFSGSAPRCPAAVTSAAVFPSYLLKPSLEKRGHAMRKLARSTPLALAAGALVLFALACGGQSSSRDTTSDEPFRPDDRPQPQVAAPGEVLLASADAFTQEVESLRAEMDFRVGAGGFTVDATADISFQAPDKVHMVMDIGTLGSFELLILGSDIFMNIAGEGWTRFSLDDLGLDAEAFEELISNGGSPLDYLSLVEELGGQIEQLPDETISGTTHSHYRGSLDFADLMAAFSDTFGFSDALPADSLSGPLTFDLWVDVDTLLPYRITLDGSFTFGSESMEFAADLRFVAYNLPVSIPEPPADAEAFSP